MATVGGVFKTIGRTAFPFITLAAQAGGPLTAMAAQQVGKALGLDKPLEGADQIEAAMAKAVLDPATQAAMAKAEQDFQVQMTTLSNGRIKDANDFEAHLEQISADDRANARAREIATKDWLPAVLAVFITLGFFGVLSAVMKFGVRDTARDLTNIMIGTLGTAWVSIVSYYFGSSSGSAAKSATLDKVITDKGGS